MRKFMLLAAVVAMVAAAVAVPALAQSNDDFDLDDFDNRGEFFAFLNDRFDDEDEEEAFFEFFFDNRFDDEDFDGVDDQQQPVVSQEIGQEAESGDVAIEGSVTSEGDYAIQCAAPLQFGNTGNLQNAQGVLQYASESDDIELEGSTFSFAPEVATLCDQAVQQSSAASSYGFYK